MDDEYNTKYYHHHHHQSGEDDDDDDDFDPKWTTGAVACNGGRFNWAMSCDFRGVVGVQSIGIISPSLTIQACAASCLALGVSSCTTFTYDVTSQTCFLQLQTVPPFPTALNAPGVVTPNGANNPNDVIECGFVGRAANPIDPATMTLSWNRNVIVLPCPTPGDPYEFATGCNFTHSRHHHHHKGYDSYGYKHYNKNNKKQQQQQQHQQQPMHSFKTLGTVSTASSLATCVAVCDLNSNCNKVFFDGLTCVLMGGGGGGQTKTVAITSPGQCARIIRQQQHQQQQQQQQQDE